MGGFFPAQHAPPPQPISFQRAMVFVDGTNIFNRFSAHKLSVRSLAPLLYSCLKGRQLVRIYLYTIKEKYDVAKSVHGEGFFDGIRVIFGDAIVKKGGNIIEKGV